MSDIKIDFIYEGQPIAIYCKENDKMKEVIDKFCFKAMVKRNSIYCLYSGNQIDENSTVKNCLKPKNENEKISILVYSNDRNNQNNIQSFAKPSQIICPQCEEAALLNVINYKIFLRCKNNHQTENIFLKDFLSTQKIDESKIFCLECKENNKSNSFNKEFFICLNCNKNLCPLCKSNHNKNHNIINYDQKNFTCFEHGDNFSLYCQTCKKNLCVACENEHGNHEIISLGKLFPDQKDLKNKMNTLKIAIDKFKEEIKKIIEVLNKVSENMDLVYKINDYVNNLFDIRKKNYELLKSIKEIKYNIILKDVNEVINQDNLYNKFKTVFGIYEKMNVPGQKRK